MSNPFRRGPWVPAIHTFSRSQIVAHRLMAVHHLLVVVTGLLGIFIDPSPSVVKFAGAEIATSVFSGAFVICGLGAGVARHFHAVAAEGWFIAGIAAARVVWAGVIVAVVFLDSPPSPPDPTVLVNYGGLQTAAIILTGAAMQAAWIAFAYSWVKTGTVAPTTSAQVHQLAEVARQLGRKQLGERIADEDT